MQCLAKSIFELKPPSSPHLNPKGWEAGEHDIPPHPYCIEWRIMKDILFCADLDLSFNS